MAELLAGNLKGDLAHALVGVEVVAQAPVVHFDADLAAFFMVLVGTALSW